MRFFLNNTVIVSRLKVTTGNLREMQTTATSEAHIQRIQESRDQAVQGVISKQYKIWVPTTTSIQEGDRIVDENGVRYDVKDVYDSQFGAADFREAIVERAEGPND